MQKKDIELPYFLDRKISQIALIVEDLEKTIENYWRFFGIGPWEIYTYEKPFVKRMTYKNKPTNARWRIAMAWIGSLNIELIEVISKGDNIFYEFVKKHGYGLHHIGINVDNAEKAIKKAEDLGIKMIQDGSGFGIDDDGHFAYLETQDLIGFVVELREIPKRRVEPDKIYPLEDK